MNDVKKLYEQMLPDGGFILDHERSIIEENQYCYALSSERGEGYFWYYFYEDMFVIEKQDFFFYAFSSVSSDSSGSSISLESSASSSVILILTYSRSDL